MEIELLKEAITIAAIGINFVAVKAILSAKLDKSDRANKQDHDKIFSVLKNHEIITNQYTQNESFYKQLDNIAGTAIEYIDDVKAHEYTAIVAQELIAFSKDVMNIGIELITDLQVDTKSSIRIKNCKDLFIKYWGQELSDEYTNGTGEKRYSFIESIKAISEDDVNSKTDRYRIETIRYLHTIVKEFVNFYNKRLSKE